MRAIEAHGQTSERGCLHLRSRRCDGEYVSTHARCAIVPILHSVLCAAAFCCYLSARPRPQSTPWTGSPWTSWTDGRAPLRDKFAHGATGTSGEGMQPGTFALKTGSWTAESASRWNLQREQWVGKRLGLACTLYTKSHITAHMCRHRTVFEFSAVYKCLCCSSSANIARRVCMQSLLQHDQTRQLFNCITIDLPSAPCPCS